MFRSFVVLKLFLLVIVAGNLLAHVTANDNSLDGAEAAAELCIDKDAGADELGTEPEMPALLVFFQEPAVFADDLGTLLPEPHFVVIGRVSIQATRAPPSALLA